MRMPKKRVYVESSVISYLTARPSRIITQLARQQHTWDWWEQRDRWDLYVSFIVVREIRDGDPNAARKRLDVIAGLPLLPDSAEALNLADYLVAAGAIPQKARDDGVHIAVAAINGMDYLVTWNQKHISNPDTFEKMCSSIREAGYAPPILMRPDCLLESRDGI